MEKLKKNLGFGKKKTHAYFFLFLPASERFFRQVPVLVLSLSFVHFPFVTLGVAILSPQPKNVLS